MDPEKYVFTRNERGIPLIAPLNSVNIELPESVPQCAIVAVYLDVPLIEGRHPEDRELVKRMGNTQVVQYVAHTGEAAWCHKRQEEHRYHSWRYAMTDTQKIQRKAKIEKRRSEARNKKNPKWRWAAGTF